MVSRNMKDQLSLIPCFYCRGAWNLEGMTAIDRHLCKMLQKAVAKKPPEQLDVWERALAAAGDSPIGWTDKQYLEPILRAIELVI